jgi:hypothetical protein
MKRKKTIKGVNEKMKNEWKAILRQVATRTQ